MFKKLKLGYQIGIGFASVILIFVILGLILFFDMFGIGEKSRALSNEYMQEINIASNIYSYAYNVMFNMRGYASTGDQQLLSKVQDDFKELKKSLETAQKFGETYTSLKQLNAKLPEIKNFVTKYEGMITTTISLKNEVDAKIAVLNQEAAKLIESYNLFTNDLKVQMNMEVNSGYNQKEFKNKLKQYELSSEVRAVINEIRVINFKSQAVNDLKMLEDIENYYKKIQGYKDDFNVVSLNEQNKNNIKNMFEAIENYKYNLDILKKDRITLSEMYYQRTDVGNTILALAEDINNTARAKVTTLANDSAAKVGTSTLLIILGFISVTILGVIFSYYIIVNIKTQINKLTEWGKRIAKGDLEFEHVDLYDNEIGELNGSFISVATSLGELSNVCVGISKGNFDMPFQIRSDKDTLGQAIDIMRSNLIEFNKKNDIQNWIKNGQMKLAEVMQGENDIKTLSNKVINILTPYIEGKVGAIYVRENEDENKIYSMYGNYAFTRRKNLTGEFKPGEGIIGQSVIEKKLIVISNIPENYISITSGLGETEPKNLAILPCVYNNEVMGIIEIANIEPFTDTQLKFLEMVSESIAIGINSAITNTKVEAMLKKSQLLTEELRVQQEELRQSNQELEEQTKILKESEAKLQAQQEELRVSNEELEEKTKELQEQKDLINNKNKNLEDAKKELETKARELETTSKYKSEFLANMSHELRTPLNSILMLAWILSNNKESNLTEKQVEFAKTIHSSGSDLLNLINEILDLSKIEAGRMELNIVNVNLHNMIDGFIKKYTEMAASRGLEFIAEIDESVSEDIYSDEQRIAQVVTNLLSNAFKFTHDGYIKLTVRNLNENDKLSDSTKNKNDYLAFEVKDTGIGIPEDKQMIIFEAFQQADGTTSRKYGGTGLGLSISRELSKLLGGEIKLTSAVNEGSTFVLYVSRNLQPNIIPSHEHVKKESKTYEKVQVKNIETIPALKHEENKTKSEKTDLAGKNSILIIEDDINFANTLKEIAEENNFDGIIAGDGETGIEYALKYLPKAIILDLGLPKIDGYGVIERIKQNKETSSIPIHVISGREKPSEMIENAIISFHKKPISHDDLKKTFDSIKTGKEEGSIKKIILIEDDPTQCKSIKELIGGPDIEIESTDSGEEAFKMLIEKQYDCMILDLGIKDISGFELIDRINIEERIQKCPIIIYTGRELTKEEDMILHKYTESIIIKGAKSPERLLAETTLFLHRVGTELNENKRKILKDLQNSGESVLNDKNILIVDDDIRNIFALTNLLEENGMKVIVGRNGREGIEKLRNAPEVDLVLMDIMMPEMDGYEAMTEIRKDLKYKNLPIIALTAKAMKGDKEKCITAGANDYLSKPVDTNMLLSLLRVWLHN